MSFSVSVAQLGLAADYAEPALARESNGDVQVYALLKGLIARESQWNPGAFRYEPAINDASYGLMQVLLSTAKGALNNPNLTPSDLFVPDTNIAAGAAYLRYQIGRYGGDYRKAVSAYNCGSDCQTRPTSFWPHGNSPYVDDVMTYQSWYLNNLAVPSDVTSPADSTPPADAASADQSGDWSSEIGIGTGVGILVLGTVAFYLLTRRT
jgi:hypothetical protein